ncbi:lytic transglycosylase domain-containing protein [Nocardioides acrostichi]|uniref:Lytic murein transglycosylase n=1 Tax=Nocardioides acrostichi TaxID=2784339 RepID=A0A930YEW6_9ACTN|nr:lytic transglycosylase domain-containing protein [Nocardioides acrostichi]MBF4163869.1 lytic murein transglycosylase [Nocardioides acrostichi]
MAGHRFGRVHKAVTLVPLGLVSAAWTASVVSTPVLDSVSAEGDQPAPAASLPDGTSVPSEAIEAPASVSTPKALSVNPGGASARQVVATSSSSSIPAAALSAYQRAEAVINSADKTCNLPWQLVAAIGRVESDHGRYGGNVLTAKGVSKPGIIGPALNGKHGTQAISDTDGGQLDGDTKWDHAVGPMQFIPSTWSVVGVDADGDAQRNPQDIDDAALATAVYLCSGNEDLSTTAGQEKAVYRYNHSQAYVDLVLKIMDAYASGDYTAVPTNVSAAGVLAPDPSYTPPPTRQPSKQPSSQPTQQISQPQSDNSGSSPSSQPTQNSGGNNAGTPSNTSGGGVTVTVPGGNGPTVTVPPLPSTSISPVDQALTYAQAVLQCTADGFIDNPLKKNDPFDKCVEKYMNP